METLNGLAQKDALLRRELEKTRQASLIASRNGDYRLVAKLTKEAARLNQELALQSEESARYVHTKHCPLSSRAGACFLPLEDALLLLPAGAAMKKA